MGIAARLGGKKCIGFRSWLEFYKLEELWDFGNLMMRSLLTMSVSNCSMVSFSEYLSVHDTKQINPSFTSKLNGTGVWGKKGY